MLRTHGEIVVIGNPENELPRQHHQKLNHHHHHRQHHHHPIRTPTPMDEEESSGHRSSMKPSKSHGKLHPMVVPKKECGDVEKPHHRIHHSYDIAKTSTKVADGSSRKSRARNWTDMEVNLFAAILVHDKHSFAAILENIAPARVKVSSKETFVQIKQVFDKALEEADFKTNVMGKYLPEGARVTNFEPLDTSAEKLRKKYNNMKADWRKKTEAAKRLGGEVFLEREPRWFSLLNGVFTAASELPTEMYHPASFVYRHQEGSKECRPIKDEHSANNAIGMEENFEPIILADDYCAIKEEEPDRKLEGAREREGCDLAASPSGVTHVAYRYNGDRERRIDYREGSRFRRDEAGFRTNKFGFLKEEPEFDRDVSRFRKQISETVSGPDSRPGSRLGSRPGSGSEFLARSSVSPDANIDEMECRVKEPRHVPEVDSETAAMDSKITESNVLKETVQANEVSEKVPTRSPPENSEEGPDAGKHVKEKRSRKKRKPSHRNSITSCHRQRKQPHRELLALAKSVRKFTSSIFALRKVTNENERQRDEMLLKFFAEQGERKRSHELQLAASHHACAAYHHTSFPPLPPHPHSFPDPRCCAVVYPAVPHHRHRSESPYVAAAEPPTSAAAKYVEH